jgi:hypothetical protein
MADRKSGKGGRKGTQRKASAKKASAKKASIKVRKRRASGRVATKKAAQPKASSKKASSQKKAVSAKAVGKPQTGQAKAVGAVSKPASRAVRPVSRAETSPLPPLPPRLTAPPKKISRSQVRRAVCASTAAQKGGSLTLTSPEPLSESELREKMRLASVYIDTWLNRRMAPEAEVSAPEEAWLQVWLWLKRAAPFDDGRLLTQDLFEALYCDELAQDP